MRGCIVKGCLELAKWLPCVAVRLPDNDRPFKLDFENLCICDTHKNRFTLNDIITDKRLSEIQTMFKMTFLTQPTREHMTLSWVKDTFRTQIPLFDSNGKPLGEINIINKDMSTKT